MMARQQNRASDLVVAEQFAEERGNGTNRGSRSGADIFSDTAGLQESAEDVGARLDAAEDFGACASSILVVHIGGVAAGAEGQDTAAAEVAGDAANGGAGGMSILSGREFCRRQNVWIERRGSGGDSGRP